MATLKNTTINGNVTATDVVSGGSLIKNSSSGRHMLKADGDHILLDNMVFDSSRILLILKLTYNKDQVIEYYKYPGLRYSVTSMGNYTYRNYVYIENINSFGMTMNDVSPLVHSDSYQGGLTGTSVNSRYWLGCLTAQHNRHNIGHDTVIMASRLFKEGSMTTVTPTDGSYSTSVYGLAPYSNNDYGPANTSGHGNFTGYLILIANKAPVLQWHVKANGIFQDSTIKYYYILTVAEMDSSISSPPIIAEGRSYMFTGEEGNILYEITETMPASKIRKAGNNIVGQTLRLVTELQATYASDGIPTYYVKKAIIVVDGVWQTHLNKTWNTV